MNKEVDLNSPKMRFNNGIKRKVESENPKRSKNLNVVQELSYICSFLFDQTTILIFTLCIRVPYPP